MCFLDVSTQSEADEDLTDGEMTTYDGSTVSLSISPLMSPEKGGKDDVSYAVGSKCLRAQIVDAELSRLCISGLGF